MNILAFLPLPALPLCTRLWVFTQFVGFLVFLELNTKCICCVECSLYVLSYVCSRKKKAVHKTTTTDDKRLQSTLKRIGVNAIPAIEEVNIFKDDVVIQFLNPKGNIRSMIFRTFIFIFFNIIGYIYFFNCIKLEIFFPVQASIAANTWVVSGSPQTKSKQLYLSSSLSYALL